MLRLKLTNVRQYENFEITLPDSGVILLRAPSGTGKTTILDGIKEALFGGVKNITSWGKSKHTIELEYLGIKIIRTRGPVSLTVEKNGETYKDDIAQEEILKTLGMRSTEFDLCSYIKQGSANSLLKLEPKEQQRLIEDLASNGVDVESVKNIIKSKISDAKKSLEQSGALVASKQESLDAIIVPDMPTEPVFLGTEEEKELAKTSLNTLHNEIQETRYQVSKKRAEISDGAALEESLKNLSLRKELLVDTEKRHIELEKALLDDNSSLSKEDVSWIESEKEKIVKKTEWLNVRGKLMLVAADLASIEPESANCGMPLGEFIKKRISEIYSDISSMRDTRAEISLKLSEAKKGHTGDLQNCPHCSNELMVRSGTIIKPDAKKVDAEEVKKLEELLSDTEKSISNAEKHNFKLEALHATGTEARSNFTEDPEPKWLSHEDVANAAEKINEAIKNNEEIQKKIDENVKKIAISKAMLENIRAEVIETETTLLSKTVAHKSREILEEEISLLEESIRETEEKINKCNEAKVAVLKHENELNLYKERLSSREKVVESKKIMENLLEEEKKTFDNHNNRLAQLQILKTRSDFAASEALDSMVASINSSASVFIDRMFDGNTMIGLRSTKTTGKGEEKAQFSVDIYHKGQEVSKISDLSGGENSRACLAYQLGLSDMYKSSILMIDEGFTGLDPETKDVCLESLKDVSQDKLVLVVEHGVPEAVFDEVIEIV